MRGGFGRRMTTGKEEAFSLKDLDRRALHLILGLVRPHLPRLLLALFAMLCATGMTLAGPYLAKVAVDDYILAGDLVGLGWIALMILVSYGLLWFSSYWQTYLSSTVAQRVIGDLRIRLYDHMQAMSVGFFEKRRTGDLLSRVIHDLEAISELVTSGFVHLLNDVLTLLGIAIVMLWLDVRLAAVTFVVLPLIAFVMNRLGKKMRRAYTEVRERLATLNIDVEENLSGIRVVQALNRGEATAASFGQRSWENLRANLRAASLFALLFPTMTISRVLGEALVFWYGGWQYIAGTISLGVIIAFLGYVRRFFAPLAELSQVYNTFQLAGASLNRTMEILDEKPTVIEPRYPTRGPRPARGEILFEDVHFAYRADEMVLEAINLRIAPGETFAIVGPTGAGKSTLVKLLVRLHDPLRGTIYLDGIDLRERSFSDLRRTITVVPQTVFLFDTTVAENIHLGNPDVDEATVRDAAETVGADAFIRALPDGYDTPVGESGARLSGGQRQLIALARALVADPKVLVLDEATSSVDPRSEEQIRRALPLMLEDRTAVIIAHRMSTIREADRIGVMENGALIAVGSHDALLRSCATYRDFVHLQTQ